MRTIRSLGVTAFAILLAPASAFAGPIDWSYTSSFHAAGQPTVPYIYVANGGTGADGSYVLEAALHGLIESGYPSNPGASPIVVGHFEPVRYNAAYQNPPTSEERFELDVTITDVASGQSGTARFFGLGVTLLTQEWTPNPISLMFVGDGSQPSALGRYGTQQSLVLGNNRYDLDVSSNGEAIWGGNGDVVASVAIRPTSTPEPSSIMLAAFGLLGAFGLTSRKSGSSRR
jgi:hypothetical protein